MRYKISNYELLQQMLKTVSSDDLTLSWDAYPCLLWEHGTNSSGYGNIMAPDKHQYCAHRLSYEWSHGPIAVGIIIMHRCVTARCVRPIHLYSGTLLDSASRRKVPPKERIPIHSKHIHGPIEVRFWPKVDKSPGHGPQGDCWIWTGATDSKGYGKIYTGTGSPASTHRLVWIFTNGPIPDDLDVLHSCDNPPCCNPDHLFTGTNHDNILDRNRKDRGGRKLNNAMVLDIKIRLRDGPTEGWSRTDLIKLLADEFDVTEGLIRHIDMGRAWTHVSTL